MHDVPRRDVELRVEVGSAEVADGPLIDGEFPGHRADDQAIRAPRRLERAAEDVVAAHLVHRHRAGELDVRFVGAQPHVLAHRELQILHLQAVEEEALEFGAQSLRPNQRRVDQVLHPRLVEVHDALVHEIGEVQHAGGNGAATRQGCAEHRPGERHTATRGEREIASQVQRLELRRRDIQREHRLRQPLEPHVPAQLGAPAIRHRANRIHADRVPVQGEAAVDIRVPHVERGDGRRGLADFEAATQLRRRPGATDPEVCGKHAFDLPDRRRDGSEHAEVHAVGARLHGKRIGKLTVSDRNERQIQRQVGGHVEHLLPRPPQVHLAVQPPVPVVEISVHERRAERTERCI